jgi:hypothetical protein
MTRFPHPACVVLEVILLANSQIHASKVLWVELAEVQLREADRRFVGFVA